jgi:hypothetical protein
VKKQKTDRKDAQLASPGEAVCLAVLGQNLARVASG